MSEAKQSTVSKSGDQNASEKAFFDQCKSYSSFIKWSAERTRLELKSLDIYIAEKIQDLAQRFQDIVENVQEQNSTLRSVKDEAGIIQLKDRSVTYSEAVSEMNKLMHDMTDGVGMTDDQFVIRKTILSLTQAIYKFIEKQESAADATSDSSRRIKSYVKDIIVTFQFQDFVKQRLDHIDLVLGAMIEHTDKLGLISGEGSSDKAFENMASELIQKFFLTRVQENFVSGLNADQAANINIVIEEDVDDDGIEFF